MTNEEPKSSKRILSPEIDTLERTALLTKRLSTAVEEISQSVVICDAEDKIVFCNQLYRDHNKSVVDYLEPGTPYETFLRAAISAGLMTHAIGREEEWLQQRLEQHRNPAGSFEVQRPGNIWLLIHEQRLEDGGIMILGTDITKQKEAERVLQEAYNNLENTVKQRTHDLTESRNRMRAIFDNAPVEIYLKDAEGRYVEINKRFEKLFNIKNRDVVGKFPDEVHDKELASLVRAHDLRVLETGEVSVEDRKAITEDGDRVLRTVKFPVYDDDQAITGLGSIVTDVTELELARSEAIRATRAKSEFLASISHELRTPLTSSLGSLGLLKTLFSADLTDQGRELLEIVARNNETLLRLVNELLDFEKFSSGTLTIATDKRDICSLTAIVVEDLHGYAREKSVQLIYEKPAIPVFVDVNEHRFEQILHNLLSNATKFSEPDSDVIISISSTNGRAIVRVEDTGSGIPIGFRDELYKPFTQADSSTTRQFSGSGLGLAISKAMTEGMGGTINFESEVGAGTTFYISFPESE